MKKLVKSTLNLIDKVGGTVTTTLSTANPPVTREIPVAEIRIAVTDPANGTGTLQGGSVAISSGDNEGLSGGVPLQVRWNVFF